MSKLDDLRAEVEAMRELLAQAGIRCQPVEAREHFGDYIEHGSKEHEAFLGLVEIAEDDEDTLLVRHTSKSSGRTFCLYDEMEALRHFPHIDPGKAAMLLLRQKVGVLESGPPLVPAGAPPLHNPELILLGVA